jgi:hypothetical protein
MTKSDGQHKQQEHQGDGQHKQQEDQGNGEQDKADEKRTLNFFCQSLRRYTPKRSLKQKKQNKQLELETKQKNQKENFKP